MPIKCKYRLDLVVPRILAALAEICSEFRRMSSSRLSADTPVHRWVAPQSLAECAL